MSAVTHPGIYHKYADASGKKPVTGELGNGEFAINEFDGKLFTRTEPGGAIRETDLLGGGGAVSRRVLDFDGYDLAAAAAGSSFNVDLASDQIVVIDDIATLTDGWSVDLFFRGSPSGFQTSYLEFEAGVGQFEFRGSVSDKFYILGGGEGFRLIKRGDVLIVYCIKQPKVIKVVKQKNNQAAYVAGSSAWTRMSLNVGSHVNFQDISGGVTVPVSGQYAVSSRIFAKWNVSGSSGYLKTTAGSRADLDRGLYLTNSHGTLKTALFVNLKAGETIKSEFHLTTNMQFYANNNELAIEFSGR